MSWLNRWPNSTSTIMSKLAEMDSKLDVILKGQDKEMADLSALTAQVAENTTVEGSAVALIQNIAAQLATSSGDQAAVDALAAQLKTSATALAAAVAANTVAAPPAA